MKRTDIILTIGKEYLQSNFENEEYSYPKAFKEAGLKYSPIKNKSTSRKYQTLDLKFTKDNISILVETKSDFTLDESSAKEQLEAYIQYEKQLTNNKIIAILANTVDNKIKVWRGTISENNLMKEETSLRSMEEYIEFYSSKTNDKEKVMQNTYKLNELLHKYGITEKLRSQFVGTCLLALKNGLEITNTMKASQIVAGIKEILGDLLTDDINKAGKLSLLDTKVLQSQDVRVLKVEDLRIILGFIKTNILPFINDKSTAGQDLLNLFFITFNKYVGKDDKNQAFTPDHITEFMTKITGVNKNSIILDPCCGSGSFLVRAMTQALDDCATASEQENIKKNQIFGIEYDENIYGLATTNMLIHSDGNSNIINGNCFEFKDFITNARPSVILMNPPYNAQKKHLPESYTKKWKKDQKEDPSKGFYFVKYILDILNEAKIQAKLAVLLPVACAIGNNKEINNIKNEILLNNTLDAVFTLPNEIFYPGASASACCMVFKVGVKHNDIMNPSTFFGYYKEDGFKKKKNLGRIEQIDINGNSIWKKIQNKWINTYRDRIEIPGFSSIYKVTGNDEWLCEAYMKTDYSTLTTDDFQETINNYLSFLIKRGMIYED